MDRAVSAVAPDQRYISVDTWDKLSIALGAAVEEECLPRPKEARSQGL